MSETVMSESPRIDWFADTFVAPYSRTQITHALAPSIDDIVQDLVGHLQTVHSDIVCEPSDVKRTRVLLRHLDSQAQNMELIAAFQAAVRRRGNVLYLLKPGIAAGGQPAARIPTPQQTISGSDVGSRLTPSSSPGLAATASISPVTPTDAAQAVRTALTELYAKRRANEGVRLDWDSSIVDLLKLLRLQSGLNARAELARQLDVQAGMNGSAVQNIALQRKVFARLAEAVSDDPKTVENIEKVPHLQGWGKNI